MTLTHSSPKLSQEGELERRLRQQAAVADLGVRALAGLGLTTVLREAVDLVARTLAVQFADIMELLPGGQELEVNTTLSPGEGLAGRLRVPASPESLAGYTLATRIPVVVDDYATETRFASHPALLARGVVSGMSVVVHSPSGPTGIVSAYTTQRRYFTPSDISFLQSVANVVGAATSRERAEKRARFQGDLLDMILEAVVATDLDGVITFWNRHAEKLYGWSAAEVVGRKIAQVTAAPIYRELADEVRQKIVSGERWLGEQSIEARNGLLLPLMTTASPIYGAGGNLEGMLDVSVDTSQVMATEEALKASDERYRELFENAHDGVYTRDLEGRFTSVNRAFEHMTGYSREKLLAMNISDLVPAQDLALTFLTPEDTDPGNEQGMDEIEFMMADGRRRPVEVRAQFIRQDGQVVAVQGIARDISERRNAELELRASEERYRELFENAIDLIFTEDLNQHLTSVNFAMERVTGYSRAELLGMSSLDVLAPEYRKLSQEMFERRFVGNTTTAYEVEILTKSGQRIPLEVSSRLILKDGHPTGLQGIARDIRERKRYEARLVYLAQHDSLSGLPNRFSLEGRLKTAVARAKRGNPSALLYLDLDQFKVVNDTLGHAGGDRLLIALASSLRRVVREEDVVARLGGDEFAVLLHDVRSAEALAIAEKIRARISSLRHVESGHVFYPRVSIGIATISGEESDAEVLAHADLACYSAKARGRNRVEFHRAGSEELEMLSGDARWAVQLNDALRGDRFRLLYQPVVNVADGKIDHYEALIRLVAADGQLIEAGTFIAAAERVGLIQEIDRWVIREGMDRMRREQAAGHPFRVAINLSGISLREQTMLGYIWHELEAFPLDPTLLSFEITETAVMTNLTEAAANIRALRASGCRFALDDFGSGFSSFAYLSELPVDSLKIDGRFIRDLATNPVSQAIVRSINDVAHATGKSTTAEFVENEATLEQIRLIGVDLAQGYYLGVPSEDLV
ncbi:MAG: PAS domain S-box protein [Dehalococcoidia bacterium]